MTLAQRCSVLATLGAVVVTACAKTAPEHLQGAHNALYRRQPQQALKEFRLALDLVEKSESSASRTYRARALQGIADTYYLELHDYRRAIETYRELVQVCPESVEALSSRARLAELLKVYFHDLRGAIAELTAAIDRHGPESDQSTYQVAQMYFELGDYRQSEIESQKLVENAPNSGMADAAVFLNAQALAMESKLDQAKTSFERLVSKFPNSRLVPDAQFEVGKILAEKGQDDRAIEKWVEALKSHPNPSVVQNAIARARKRIESTTPVKVGSVTAAFARPVKTFKPRNSVEAVGGSKEEEVRDHGD